VDHALTAVQAEPYKSAGYLGQIATIANSLADKNRDLADELIERLTRIQDLTLTPAHPLYNPWPAASYYENHGRWREAEGTWNAYMVALENAGGPESTRLTEPLLQIANLFNQQGRYQDAVASAQRALSIEEKAKGPNSSDLLRLLGVVGQYYFNLQDAPRAMEYYERKIGLSNRTHGRTQVHAQTLAEVAEIYIQHQQLDRAIELASQAVDIASQTDCDQQARNSFRMVLDSARQQKTAATRSDTVAANIR
jgi:tetratricopeptide (TPR) repeat protein